MSKRSSTAQLDTWRNRLAVRICNLILNTVASREYRETIGELIIAGMKRHA